MALMNRVRVVWTGVAGGPYYSNFYSAVSSVPPSIAASAVATLITALKPIVTNQLQAFVEGDVAIVESTTNTIVGVNTVTSTTIAMSGSAAMAPKTTQGLVRFLTGTFAGGRQIRGRMSIPGVMSSAVQTNGTATTVYTAAVDGAFLAYLSTLSTGAVVFSRKNGTAVPISNAKTWNEFGVLRSRRD